MLRSEDPELYLEKAVHRLCDYYGKALTLEYVRNKIAWALYQTWKEFDKKGEERRMTSDLQPTCNQVATDTISRQDAIDAFRKSLCALEIESGREYGISFSGVERILKSLPSAQSKRMRGRWVKDEEASSQHIESIYVCSACNNMDAWGEAEKNTFKFCPNCGADMRGEQDG